MPESYNKTADDGPGYTYTYDKRDHLVQVQDPEGNTIRRYEYNGHYQVIFETDGEGKETRYSYNGLGQRTRQQVSIRREGDTTYYRVIAYRYDQQGNKTEEAYGRDKVRQDQEPAGWHRIRLTYDGNNRLITVKDEFGARARYDYDCLGNLIRIKPPKGFQIRRTYDGNDRLSEERILDQKNGIDRRVCYTYDAAGNQTSVTVKGAGAESGNGIVTHYQYDADGNVFLLETRLREEKLLSSTYRYDAPNSKIPFSVIPMMLLGIESARKSQRETLITNIMKKINW